MIQNLKGINIYKYIYIVKFFIPPAKKKKKKKSAHIQTLSGSKVQKTKNTSTTKLRINFLPRVHLSL